MSRNAARKMCNELAIFLELHKEDLLIEKRDRHNYVIFIMISAIDSPPLYYCRSLEVQL